MNDTVTFTARELPRKVMVSRIARVGRGFRCSGSMTLDDPAPIASPEASAR